MSLPRDYPPDHYHGETGEPSAWLRRSDQRPEVTYPAGGTCEYLATGDQTKGRFGISAGPSARRSQGPTRTFTA